MPHPFPIKEIARQAGLSTATVDRVMNQRPGVRRQTANRVMTAIRELEAQEAQLSMAGRKLMIDLLVEAPPAFLNALQDAVARELPLIQTAIFRVRSDLRARFPAQAMASALDRAARLKSDGVIVMAPDTAPLRRAVDRLTSAGIPVVTLATDMPATGRVGYVGLDNFRAGETAAWLIRKWARPDAPRRVLVIKRNEAFHGETDREKGFRAAMAQQWPAAEVNVEVQGEEGPDFARRLATDLAAHPVAAIYSIGGGNRNLLAALAAADLPRPLMIGHDLDPENRALLAQEQLDAVLYHDLAEDIRHACQSFMSVHSRGTVPMPAQGAVLRVMLPPMLTTQVRM
ncbi:LacI family DNA-binding transcriptional regulator [Paracoccus seriniphilus]|uniref:LacI family transcriptional regulator n=1 Tax=Paracoccus seriniphilus TaxID=184748 RepID=A0A239PZH8_9RHOB|nr:LacI family DNA-binding transcriptional regulator [Paracoccus seriniphilus]WCR15650.1 LacI family DNA-binding transcriptional regulator [Paracoccus seriniphilus]SNT75674.1 LacI family transcriptional regulator [Paracoccus seriniphilus]